MNHYMFNLKAEDENVAKALQAEKDAKEQEERAAVIKINCFNILIFFVFNFEFNN